MTTRFAAQTILVGAARTADGATASLNTGIGSAVSVCVQTTAKTGTSPTLTCKFQWSFDGANWLAGPTADDFAAVSDTAATVNWKDVVVRAPHMRIAYTFGGTATPGYTFSVKTFVRS